MRAISVKNLSKTFKIYARPSDRLKEFFFRKPLHSNFAALQGISFEVLRGKTVGLIGQNGSGKSTLLKILGGLMQPTTGTVEINGCVSSLIELGTGFHPEFSGRANVYMNASLRGMPREEVDRRFPEILEFSGLEGFIDRPLKTYSTGMWVRLAFSAAISVDPEILLIDEALAVGDALFQHKCLQRLRQLQEQGRTIFFVSHDMAAVKTFCEEAMLLDQGQLAACGKPDEVCALYISLLAQRASQDRIVFRTVEGARARFDPSIYSQTMVGYGNFDVEISHVELLSARGETVQAVVSGDIGRIRIHLVAHRPVADPVVGVLIRDRMGNDIYGTNTFYENIKMGDWPAGRIMEVEYTLKFDLAQGDYFISVAAHGGRDHLGLCYHWIDVALVMKVLPPASHFAGHVRLPTKIAFREAPVAKIGRM
ncbi:MAG: ABC transporter ATP-binding protein [Acidobacteria bacterium]|nr:ABC transporter ATP-binding protein [Acidobacteriota bacterium]